MHSYSVYFEVEFFPLFADIDGDAPGFEFHEGHTVTNLNPVYSYSRRKTAVKSE